jgi:hypothetical protein
MNDTRTSDKGEKKANPTFCLIFDENFYQYSVCDIQILDVQFRFRVQVHLNIYTHAHFNFHVQNINKTLQRTWHEGKHDVRLLRCWVSLIYE